MFRLPSLLAVAAVLGAAALGAGACCEWNPDACAVAVDDAGPPPETPGGELAYATPGCSVDDISDQNGAVCAVCGDAQICGDADVARCESREKNTGETCRFCATPSGEILYDSCNSGTDRDSLHCEASPNDPGTGLGQGEGVQCETCTDAAGNVVNTVCEPAHDECHPTTDQNLTCRECTLDGQIVIHDCEQPDLSPRSCEVYGDDLGRCVDCYGDDDQILSHSCSLTASQLVTCAASITSDGIRCTECVDELGALVSRSCDTQVPQLSQCAELDYTEQTCIVCVDAADSPAVVTCTADNCDPNTDPACAPADCRFTFGQNGELCRTCPGPNGDEERCVVDTNLVCENAAGADGTASCLSCSDLATGVEVYRRCDGGQQPAPPVCASRDNATGTSCEICNDPQTQEDIYATCGGETCFALGSFQITGANGQGLFVDNAPAVSTCVQCAASTDAATPSALDAACSLRDDCPAVDLTNPEPFCSSTVVFDVLPRQCNNPWETAGFSAANAGAGGVDELNRILAYALATQTVGIVSIVETGGGAPAPGCADGSCACGRGDVVEVAVRPGDAAKMSTLFGDTLLRCASDADCRTGGLCRADGACTVAP